MPCKELSPQVLSGGPGGETREMSYNHRPAAQASETRMAKRAERLAQGSSNQLGNILLRMVAENCNLLYWSQLADRFFSKPPKRFEKNNSIWQLPNLNQS